MARAWASPRWGGIDTLVFNVGGRHFEVLRQTIEAYPSTLLACLVGDIGTDLSAPIFVDANPDRFPQILDWYRYGEMFVPEGLSVKALLRDARFFLLPDVVTINHTAYPIGMSGAAHPTRSYDAVMKDIAATWEGFDEYIERVMTEADQVVARAVEESRAVQHDSRRCCEDDLATAAQHVVHLAGFTPQSIQVGGRWVHRMEHTWNDERNVCNKSRLQLLVHELSKRGLLCRVEADQDGGLHLRLIWRRPESHGTFVDLSQAEPHGVQ